MVSLYYTNTVIRDIVFTSKDIHISYVFSYVFRDRNEVAYLLIGGEDIFGFESPLMV